MGYSFKNNAIYDGSSVIGNIKGNAIYSSKSSLSGSGKVVGNIKNDAIYESKSSLPGSGKVIGNVKNAMFIQVHLPYLVQVIKNARYRM